jgi:hypothetical protein
VKDIELPANVIGKLKGDGVSLSSVCFYFGEMFTQFLHDRDRIIQDNVKKHLEFLFTLNIRLLNTLQTYTISTKTKLISSVQLHNMPKRSIRKQVKELKCLPEMSTREKTTNKFQDECKKLEENHRA